MEEIVSERETVATHDGQHCTLLKKKKEKVVYSVRYVF